VRLLITAWQQYLVLRDELLAERVRVDWQEASYCANSLIHFEPGHQGAMGHVGEVEGGHEAVLVHFGDVVLCRRWRRFLQRVE